MLPSASAKELSHKEETLVKVKFLRFFWTNDTTLFT